MIAWAGLGFIILLALTGGASRSDVAGQMIVRSAAIAGIVAAILQTARPIDFVRYRLAYLFVGLISVLMACQLVPLPPGIWTALPGRDLYRDAAIAANVAQPWRPLNLTPDLGWDSLLGMLVPLAALVLASCLRPNEVRLTVGAMLMIAVVSAILGLVQMAQGPDGWLYYYAHSSIGSPTGLLANRNHQAVLLAASLPAAAIWVNLRKQPEDEMPDRTRLWLGLGATAVLLLVLVATGSRAGLAVGAVALLAATYFWRPIFVATLAHHTPRFRQLSYLALALVIAGSAMLTLMLGKAQSVQRLVALGVDDDVRGTAAARLWTMLQTFFPAGSGFGSFDRVYRRFEMLSDLRMTYLNEAHNDAFQVLIEGGIAGLALVIVYLLWWFWRTFAIWRAVPRDAGLGRLGTIVTGVAMAASVADYPVRTPIIAALFVVASLWMFAPVKQATNDGDALGAADAPS